MPLASTSAAQPGQVSQGRTTKPYPKSAPLLAPGAKHTHTKYVKIVVLETKGERRVILPDPKEDEECVSPSLVPSVHPGAVEPLLLPSDLAGRSLVPAERPQPRRKIGLSLSRRFHLLLSSSQQTGNPAAVSALVSQDNGLKVVDGKRRGAQACLHFHLL